MTTEQIKRVEKDRNIAIDRIEREMAKKIHLRDYASISANAKYVDDMNRLLKGGYYFSETR